MWHGYYGMGYESSLFGFVMTILWWLLIIIAIVVFVRWVKTEHKDSPGQHAIDILKNRYARGEIDKKEFEEKKKDLMA